MDWYYQKIYLTFQTLFVLQNISRQTMADTVVVDMDTLCIVYAAGITTIPSHVFSCSINCVCFSYYVYYYMHMYVNFQYYSK